MLAILGDYQLFFPFLTTSAAIPSYFYTLAKRDDVRAVFDIPWDHGLTAKEAIYYQIAHQKPLVGGHVIRRTPVDPAKLSLLEAAITGQLTYDAPDQSLNLALLNEYGADAVVVHRRYPDAVALSLDTITKILGAPVYQDEGVVIYNAPHAEHPLDPGVPLLAWQSNLYGDQKRDPDLAYIYVPQDSYIQLWFEFDPEWADKAVMLEVDNQVVGTGTIPNAVNVYDNGSFHRRVNLARGFHTVRLIGADPQPRLFADRESLEPAGPYTRNIALGESVSLMSAHAEQDSANLKVDLLWHAAQKLPGDYHIFVHLLDSSGKLAAQYDAEPGDGLYPTSQWNANQDWSEAVSLPIFNLPPGAYELYTGWYSYPDLKRLAVYADTPHAADGLVFLQRVTIGKP